MKARDVLTALVVLEALLLVLWLLPGGAEAHETGDRAHDTEWGCPAPRHLALADVYAGTERTGAAHVAADFRWTWQGNVWLNPRLVETVDVRPGSDGVFLRSVMTASSAIRYLQDGNDERRVGFVVFYFLAGAELGDVLHRLSCHHPYEPPPPVSVGEARDRAEARRFQVLRALEELRPEDLL